MLMLQRNGSRPHKNYNCTCVDLCSSTYVRLFHQSRRMTHVLHFRHFSHFQVTSSSMFQINHNLINTNKFRRHPVCYHQQLDHIKLDLSTCDPSTYISLLLDNATPMKHVKNIQIHRRHDLL
jgi:hypothetical protein